MNKVQKAARQFIFRLIKAQLKDYRKREDSDRVEKLIEKALDKNSEKDVDVSFHGQHCDNKENPQLRLIWWRYSSGEEDRL